VDRCFLGASSDRLWLADITYIPSKEGALYLVFILDACSRKVVGWSMANHLKEALVLGALEMTLWRRRPPSGVIHHSERGSQYHSRPSEPTHVLLPVDPGVRHVNGSRLRWHLSGFFLTAQLLF